MHINLSKIIHIPQGNISINFKRGLCVSIVIIEIIE